MTWPAFLLGLWGTATLLAAGVILAVGDPIGWVALCGGVLLLHEAGR